jgi:hypothetical protein
MPCVGGGPLDASGVRTRVNAQSHLLLLFILSSSSSKHQIPSPPPPAIPPAAGTAPAVPCCPALLDHSPQPVCHHPRLPSNFPSSPNSSDPPHLRNPNFVADELMHPRTLRTCTHHPKICCSLRRLRRGQPRHRWLRVAHGLPGLLRRGQPRRRRQRLNVLASGALVRRGQYLREEEERDKWAWPS